MKVLLALVALWAWSVPQNTLAKERSFVLPNGLRVTLVEAPDASRVAILVNVAAGSADERSDQRGIAHLAEHVFARGFTLGERHALQAADRHRSFARWHWHAGFGALVRALVPAEQHGS